MLPTGLASGHVSQDSESDLDIDMVRKNTPGEPKHRPSPPLAHVTSIIVNVGQVWLWLWLIMVMVMVNYGCGYGQLWTWSIMDMVN